MFHRALLRRIGVATLLALIASLFAGIVAAPAMAAPPLELTAESAVLLDFTTGQVLYEKNADQVIPPASLTKLMTLHIVYKKLAEGEIKREDLVQISRNAWNANPVFTGSSLMFLEPGQKVTVGELMKGLAIVSGNDAAIALAEHIAGSVDAFVKMMNDEAAAMGYKQMHFVDPHGLSPENKVTAREYADFARRYIQLHPESLEELHSQKSFEYPKYENLPEERKAATTPEQHVPIRQENRNGLLWTYEGVDGLKTGFVDEAGFNIALTAKRGEMRLIAVLLGVAKGASIPEGSARREEEGAALLTWGFDNFVTEKPALPELKPVRVWKGASNQVALKPAQEIFLTLEKGAEKSVTATVHQEESVVAPVQAGQKLGELIFAADGKEIARFPLVAAEDVPQGGFFKRLWDSLRLLVMGLFKR